MAEVERSIYFYQVEVDGDQGWRRADALRGLDALTGNNQVLDLGDENYAWARVDRIPNRRQFGRVRFFRDRRSNLPGYAVNFDVNDLPIPDEAGLVEPTHMVFGGGGLIAAEYNHFGPRVTTHFATLLRDKLDMDVRIGTYVQGDILDQLDRLTYIQLAEFSIVPTPELEEQLRNAGTLGEAAAALARTEGGKRAHLTLSGEKGDSAWTHQAREFVKHLLNVGENETKVLKVRGYDPVAGGVEWVDLLKQKLVRRVDFERPSARSKALDTTAAYVHLQESVREVRETDLPNAAVVF